MHGILVNALIYFSVVFGVGFMLGIVRVLLLVPALGERYAELIETPFMLVAIYYSARFVVRRSGAGYAPRGALVSGIFALVFLLLVEFTVVLGLRGLSLQEYFDTRDPVSGSVYVISLLIFMLMPWLVARFSRR